MVVVAPADPQTFVQKTLGVRGRQHLGPQGSVRPGCPAGAAGPVTVTMTLAT